MPWPGGARPPVGGEVTSSVWMPAMEAMFMTCEGEVGETEWRRRGSR